MRKDKCIHELFEEQVRKTPKATALVYEEQTLSYEELNRQANQLSHYLISLGVKPDERVGICVERGVGMVVGLLGILKAGGAYVPLDPAYPYQRLREILDDAGPRIVLSDAAGREALGEERLEGIRNLSLELAGPGTAEARAEWAKQATTNPDAKQLGLNARKLAYVIYTSGSTGRPKGVMVEHGSVVNFLCSMAEKPGISAEDRLLAVTSISFDIAGLELYLPLSKGARIVLASRNEVVDPYALQRSLERHGITIMQATPSTWRAMLDAKWKNSAELVVLCGGEALPGDLASRLRDQGGPVWNMYGPTETTIWSSCTRVLCREDNFSSVSIGRPIANTKIYLLDGKQRPVPLGAAGEIYIGGAGVARGYLNREELTAERFVRDPFTKVGEGRMYRTGDLGRYLPDGSIEFLGRNDQQVKIRGFRIELEEIEARLAEHDLVREAVVVAREDSGGEKRLVAYVVVREEMEAGELAAMLRTHLVGLLPEYMVPAAFVQLEALPLTPNGKLDRKALPEPQGDAYAQAGYEEPQGKIEEQLAGMWQELLGVERVGRQDHFFELGGHSLLAMRLIARVQQVLGVELAVTTLFARPRLEQLAEAVREAGAEGKQETLEPIVPISRVGAMPLSFAQQRLWFLGQMEGVSATYHIPAALRLRGELDKEALKRSLDGIWERHEGLRSVFVAVEGEPRVELLPVEIGLPLLEHDVRGTRDAEAQLKELMRMEAQAPFDLKQGPLIRARLVRMEEREHVLLVTQHHIVSDGWSMGILARELGRLYGAFSRGEENPLEPLGIQYPDYAAWQREWLSGERLQKQSEYWREALADAPVLLELPTDRPRPEQQSFAGGYVPVVIERELAEGLKELSRRQGTTLFMTVLSGWVAVLSRLSGQAEMVIGAGVANRRRAETEGLIGFFVNTLALRIDLRDEPSVVEMLKRAKGVVLGAQEHQDMPFEQVVEIVQPPRHLNHTPVFQVIIQWLNNEGILPEFDGMRIEELRMPHEATKFDLHLALSEKDGRIVGGLNFARALFEQGTIERHTRYLKAMLEAMVADSRQKVSGIEIIGPEERQQLLEEWNATGVNFGADVCVHELFERQVEQTPDNVAVEYGSQEITYRELDRRANQLARYLRKQGVGPEMVVGIWVERSLEMVVAILGVLKAGGAFMPLDGNYPEERLEYMIEDAQVALMLVGKQQEKKMPRVWVPVVVMDGEDREWEREEERRPESGVYGGNLAYVIYTSGSTGKPKGVGVEHRQLANYIQAIGGKLQIEAGMRLALLSTYAADLGYTMIFPALCYGGCLNVVDADWVLDAGKLAQHFSHHPIDYLKIVPSHLQALLGSSPGNGVLPRRWLVVGGEASSWELIRQVKERGAGCRVLNHYGPTETTVGVLTYDTTQESDGEKTRGMVPVGRPLSNGKVYVLDKELNPAGIGTRGEIYIGGAGLARGYVNRAEMTAERFMPDPFSRRGGKRLYRTGDVGRYREDGNIEYIGRKDEQVKIRGYRIELGEIEATLALHSGVREAVVVARGENGDNRLVAYYTLTERGEEEEIGAEQLRSFAAEKLPEYMVPAAFMRLEAMPLTPNGKLDRKALPKPEGEVYAQCIYEPPQSELEQILANIWQELLGVERVGRHDHFFQLGGHSLLAVRLIEQLHRANLHIKIDTLFTKPVLSELAAALVQHREVTIPLCAIHADSTSITPEMLPLINLTQQDIDRIIEQVPGGVANIQDIYALSPLQDGILFHHLMAREGDPYVIGSEMAFTERGLLDRFLSAVQQVIDRHDILRTAFIWQGLSQPVQVVWRQAQLSVTELKLDSRQGAIAEQLLQRRDPRKHRFDLSRPPLLHYLIAHDPDHNRWVLLQSLHHLVGDHSASDVLRAEVQAVLAGQGHTLAAPPPFRNLVAQAQLGVSREEHESFFRQMLGDVTEPTLPFGLSDVYQNGGDISESRRGLPQSLNDRLRAQSRRIGVSLASLCHLAWGLVLARSSGSEPVVLGTVLLGRMQAGEGATTAAGLFINTLPLRLDLDGRGTETAARQTHANMAELLVHEHASLALAQRCSGVALPSPLFSAILNYRHNSVDATLPVMGENTNSLAGIEFLGGNERTNYPLAMSVVDDGQSLGLIALVVQPLAERICGYMQQALESLAHALENDPQMPVRRLEVLPPEERQLLLETWNTTEIRYPADKCIHELFEEQVERTPEAVAVVFEEAALSYAELNRRANRLAHYLRELGVEPDARVAICLERSLEMIVALLAVLKAGGAYVPLDPAYPGERLQFMLEDSAPVLLLTKSEFKEQFADCLPIMDFSDAGASWKEYATTNLDPASLGLTPEHLFYVVYTSGSTGTPKGSAVPHRSIAGFIFKIDYVHFDAETVFLQHSSTSWDVLTLELWPALLTGGRCVLSAQQVISAEDLKNYIQRDGVNTLWLSSALFTAITEAEVSSLLGLRELLIGGEAPSPVHVEQALKSLPGTRIVNGYGPSECTVFSNCYVVESSFKAGSQSLPVGRPIGDRRVYVLDKWMNPVPVGVAGELYIGGAGVARGYLNRAELTAEKFVADPFAEEAGARMYRTGDLGRWLEDGTIEFLGRNDFQVKIRGFRIELGEIEARLAEHELVRESVVLARGDGGGEKRLVAYVVARGETDAGELAAVLRTHLAGILPEYMVPTAYVRLASMPLTPNGKLDRKALPQPEGDAYAVRGYEAPQGEIETQLAETWADLLHVERVGRHDDFFALGGHSVLAVRLVMRIQQVLGMEVTIKDLFARPVLTDFAQHIANAARAKLPLITRAGRDKPLPLSLAQQRLWFLAQMEGVSKAYHIPVGLRLLGQLDGTALRRALDRIVARHEALRTTFIRVDEEVVQRIGSIEDTSFLLLEHDLREHREAAAELERLVAQEANDAFNLEEGPLIRGRLIRQSEDEHTLLITMHHIVSDGWSMGVLIKELSVLYGAFVRGHADPLPELSLQYADYAVWQRQWIEGEILREQAEYWKNNLAGVLEVLELPADHARPAQQDLAGAVVELALDEELTAGLKQLSKRHGTTLYMTLLASWAVLMGRLSGQPDVVIGTPVANRGRVEIEGLVGFFVNTLALRLDVGGSPAVSELLARVKAQAIAAQLHQDIPFEQVVEMVRPVRSLAHNPLFQVMFAWQNLPGSRFEMPGLEVGPAPSAPHAVAKFDMALTLREAGERIVGEVVYATALYERSTIERYLGYLRRLLQEMVADDSQVVDRVPLLGEAERQQVLYGWNETRAEYPGDKYVHQLFEEQVERTPEAVAVVFEEAALSYAELNRRANQLGHYLRRQGVGPEVKVAVCVERSLEMVVALLGVLKSGGAYVPLELKHPAERLKYMLEDSQAAVLLTRQEMLDRLPEFGGTVVRLDGQEEEISCQISENPTLLTTSESLMYVIYTSGSTGKPKGVAGTHRSMVNRLTWMQRTFPVTEDELCCQKTSLSFIDAVAEIFGPLVCGAPLLIIAESVVNDAKGLVDLLARRRITRIVLVPSLLRAMLADEPRPGHLLDKLRLVVTSGEALEAELANLFQSAMPDARLLNIYGATEVAADATWCTVSRRKASDPILIGRPFDNVRAFVLNDDLEPLPVGMAGEVYIAGAGLARGYLNRADLTAEKFVPDCFSGLEGERLYRTGDRARWQASGQLEFLGRRDHQVKVRGYRIELGEIEVMLLGHRDVEQAVVALDREQRLVGYVVKRSGAGELTVEQLRSYLQERLPGYMVPGAFVIVDRLPLTTSGKVDRKALPEPQWVSLKEEHEVAFTAEEEILCGIFCGVLKQVRVGISNNFFEIGGHSLLATQVVSRVRTAFGVELTVRALFEAPTVAGLAERVRNLRGAGPVAAPIVPVAREGDLPLSFAQQRLWFLDQLHPNSSAYNIPYTMRMKGVLNVDATREALSEIVKRHEVLRTIFIQTQQGPVQRVQRCTEFSLEVEDLCGIAPEEREAEMLHRVQAEADRPFDLEHGPVLRARILQLEKEDHVLQVVIHHIATDGWSQHILLREFAGLYTAFAMGQPSPLAEMKLQYGDFAVCQRHWLKGEVLAGQVGYWKKELHGMHALDLPVDSRRTGVGQSVGRVPFLIAAESMQKIKQLSISHHATVFMVLTAAFHLLLGWYAGQEDVVTGTDVANRNWKEVEGMIGFFVNQLVLRTDLSGDPAFSELLQRVRTAALGAYTHQDVPFEKIVEELAPARVGDQLPFFNVKMIMLNTPEALQISLPGLQIEAIPVAVSAPRYLLAFTLWERAGALHGGLDYSQEMFRESSIELFLLLFREILDLAVADPGIRLNAIREQLHRLKESHQQQRKVSLQDKLERRFSSVKRVTVAVN